MSLTWLMTSFSNFVITNNFYGVRIASHCTNQKQGWSHQKPGSLEETVSNSDNGVAEDDGDGTEVVLLSWGHQFA